jgi:hypothetical protein
VTVGASAEGTFASLSGSGWGTYDPASTLQFADVYADSAADVVEIKPDGAVKTAASTGTGFETPSPAGSWQNTHYPVMADISGDSRADIVGRDPLTGTVKATTASLKTPQAAAPDEYTDDPQIPYEPEDTPLSAAAPKCT